MSSGDAVSASTSRAPSGCGEPPPPPLAYKTDVEPVLAQIRDLPDAVLVGGQALNFWADYYVDRLPPRPGPLTSGDIDFVGPPRAASECAKRLGGSVQFAELDHATANYAVVRFNDGDGHERIVDFLERICGVDPADLSETAMLITPLDPERAGFQLRVMQPVVCMESRISNVVEYEKYRGDHGRQQATMSIHCAKAFLMDLLDQGQSRAVQKLNERIFRFAKGRRGRSAAVRFQLEPFAAVVLDDRLPEAFRTTRYPQMQRAMERERGRPRLGLER